MGFGSVRVRLQPLCVIVMVDKGRDIKTAIRVACCECEVLTTAYFLFKKIISLHDLYEFCCLLCR